MDIIKTKLKFARIDRRYTQAQFAKLSGYSRVTIVNLESKKNKAIPKLNLLKVLCKYLNISLLWLLNPDIPLKDLNNNYDFKDDDYKFYISKNLYIEAINEFEVKNPTIKAINYHLGLIIGRLKSGAVVNSDTDKLLSEVLLYTIKSVRSLE